MRKEDTYFLEKELDWKKYNIYYYLDNNEEKHFNLLFYDDCENYLKIL